MNPICFYHKADLDGVCSAAIVKHFVPDCELYGIDYGDAFPWDKVRPGENPAEQGFEETFVSSTVSEIPFRKVYMVDFSLPTEDMKRLDEVSDLVYIDHHATAKQALIDAWGWPIRGVFMTQCAACELTWAWFTNHQDGERWSSTTVDPTKIPEAVRLLGVYDSWRSDDPEWDSKVLPFQYGMRSALNIYDPTDFGWKFLFDVDCPDSKKVADDQVARFTSAGCAILSFQAQQNAKIAEAGAFESHLRIHKVTGCSWWDVDTASNPAYEPNELGDFRCVCVNAPYEMASGIGHQILETRDCDVAVVFTQTGDRRWKVSLRSKDPAVDCGAIAKTFGGGGHKGAAGFVCDVLPWEES